MKKYLLSIIAVIAVNTLYAQWTKILNPCFEGIASSNAYVREKNIILYSYNKVFLSNDNALSWKDVTPDYENFFQASANHGGLSKIYVNTEPAWFAYDTDSLYASNNNGKLWVSAWNSSTPFSCKMIRGVAGLSGKVFVLARSKSDMLYHIFYSSDTAKTWSQGALADDIKLLHSNRHHLYASKRDSIYSSSDGITLTYIPVGLGSLDQIEPYLLQFSDQYIFYNADSLYRVPLSGGILRDIMPVKTYDGSYLCVADSSLYVTLNINSWDGRDFITYRSFDGGNNWQISPSNGLYYHYSRSGSGYKLDAGRLLWLSFPQGCFISDDKGDHWTATNKGLEASIYTFGYSGENGLLMLQNNERYVNISYDYGQSWKKSYKGIDSTINIFHSACVAGNKLFISALYDPIPKKLKMLVSSDNGETWSKPAGTFNGEYVRYLLGKDSLVFLSDSTSGHKIYRYNINSAAYTDISAGLDPDWKRAVMCRDSAALYLLLILPGPNFFMVYRSSDNGNSWQKDSSGLKPMIAPQSMITGKNGSIIMPAYNFFYEKTTNGWDTITPVSGLTQFDASTLTFAGQGYFMSYYQDVYFSPDLRHWAKVTWNLPELYYVDERRHFIASGNSLICYSHEHLPYRISGYLGTKATADISHKQLLLYPNPTPDTHTLEIDLSWSGLIEIELYDHSGRMLEKIFREKLSAGKQLITLNVSGLKPGIYFYVVRDGKTIRHVRFLKSNM